ncbi:hypothetical protein [Pseudomonas gessardii]|uniref:hypothetical protein n=1 Tax=Pseudomonas gessardii TaxID=78544 RepID=UPI00147591BE|nr:hypothetical protein [Pseudomonas gessardii]NNA66241.1 hypothetical protein [Pseudomonas gessardii]
MPNTERTSLRFSDAAVVTGLSLICLVLLIQAINQGLDLLLTLGLMSCTFG